MDTTRRIAIVAPTYNEKDNIREFIRRIMDLTMPNTHLFIVDDNSPDGTGKIADELAMKYPIMVLHRPQKAGLGKAYVDCFQNILQNDKKIDYIIQMDADLSHEPESIPRFLEKIETCDVVLGSRYIRGGSIENWDFFRRLISRFGNIYASAILGVSYKDLTSGFKCFRREVLESIDLTTLSSVGYNFQIETTYRAYKKGFRIREVPIIFTERKFGISKFNVWIILESFWKVLMLRFKK